jgi:hypothetical protein
MLSLSGFYVNEVCRILRMISFFLSIFHLFAISGCCCFFFIVFLTHMHNRLVSLTCTDYRSNADDSTLFNCCCRSMALLNFSIHVRMINQMIVVSIYSFFLHREVLVHYWQYVFLMMHMNNQRIEVI